jgi:hypothetical protein
LLISLRVTSEIYQKKINGGLIFSLIINHNGNPHILMIQLTPKSKTHTQCVPILQPEPGKKFVRHRRTRNHPSLTPETVESAALSFECIDNIERSNGLALGMFCVCDCIPNNALEEGLENTSGFLVDH